MATVTRQANKYARRRQKQLAWAKKQGGWNKARLDRPNCPTPGKRRFASKDAAVRESGGKRAYYCPCGEWHLTNKGAPK